jgi:very-short-patch-repair endonuclease
MDALEFRKQLRRDMTDAEHRLWFYLRGKRLAGYKFKRQYSAGNYVLDFYCSAAALAVEIDGAHHFEDDQCQHDSQRTSWLAEQGIEVLRFDNRQVLLETDGVLNVILKRLNQK